MDGKNAVPAGLACKLLFAALLVAMIGCQSQAEDPPPDPLQPPQMTLPVNPGAVPPGTTGTPVAQPPVGSATPPATATPPNTTPPGGDVPPPVGMPQAGSAAPPVEPTAGSMAEPPAETPTEPETMTPPPRMDLGKGDGKDVITIGDSWMTLYGGGIEGGLDRAGTRYRHYGVAGTTLINGDIPRQYDRSKSSGKAATVIMTGGGNDIMFSGGCNTTEACEASVMRIQAALNELWTKMSADGVTDVIYVQYSKDAGTAPSGTRPTTPPPPVPICVTGPIKCHSLPTTDLVMGQLPDGIHPSGAAHDRIAKALLEMMEMRGMRR